MKLILIRHAKAGDRDDPKYPDDRLRPLSGEGRKEHKQIARALRKMSVEFDRLWTSPLVRAETAEITAREMGYKGPTTGTDLLGEAFSVDGVIAMLKQCPQDAVVACVGHEPHLGRLAAALLHRDGDFAIKFKKSAVLGIEFPSKPGRGQGVLLYFCRPEHLVSLIE